MSRIFAFVAMLSFSPLVLAGQPAMAAQTDAQELRSITLSIPNMTCGLCPLTIRSALEKVPGVSGVKPNLDRKTVTVTYDPRKTDVAALTRATTDAGYPSHPLG